MRIAVVGGGVSGCCAAAALAEKLRGSARVTLFESGRGAGGRASTRRLESGNRVDHGERSRPALGKRSVCFSGAPTLMEMDVQASEDM